MNSPPSSSKPAEVSSFEKFHTGVQRWIWSQNWEKLHNIQERATAPILSGQQDVIIAAPTAGGKTEAAFMPIASVLAELETGSIHCLCISPLKALINDQHERLQYLFESVEVPVYRWHGDVSAAHKKKVISNPSGLLIITPESLEAILIRHGSRANLLFGDLRFVVVDELHAFIGTERGKQLQSLLCRIELCARREVPRIGLSATLGDMMMAANFLRLGKGDKTLCIVESDSERELKLQLRGYIRKKPQLTESNNEGSEPPDDEQDEEESASGDLIEISNHLFRVLRGTDNLIFANSRRLVETLADLLRRHCEKNHVPVEFFPHHGSLSKEIREEAEDFIKDTTRPGNIVCTSTLELGIDIGSVNSIAQIGSPPSVASMRQRLGRSGRRKGESSILRLYAAENEITSRTHVVNTLRSQVIQSIAMVELLLSGWNEAPSDEVYHFSTLVQQTLSLIAQYGGVSARDAWRILCQNGAFSNVDQKMYIAFLRALGVSDLLTQTHDGELVLGYNGEKLVEHFDFYAAFSTPDEYRLIAGQRVLGSIPVDFPLFVGLHLIFAGRRWQVDEIDDDSNTIYLHPYPGGIPPKFGGSGALISDEIRKKMFEIYEDSFVPQYLNKGAIQLLSEGRQNFKTLRLSERSIIQSGKHCYIFPWMGDRVMNTMLLQLTSLGLAVQMGDLWLEVQNVSLAKLKSIIQTIPENLPLDADKLTKEVENLENEKHDHFLPDELLRLDYARRFLSIESSGKVFCNLVYADTT